MAVSNVYSGAISNFQRIAHNYWPLSDATSDKLKKVALGIFTAIPVYHVADLIGDRIIDLMKLFNVDISAPQDIIQIWESIDGISSGFLILALKTALMGYIVFVGPAFEEWLFRDKLFAWMRDKDNPDALSNRVLRVVGNGFLFGAAHLSPFQGWSNVPVFFVTFFIGCSLASLREITKDTTASTAAHMMNNGIGMYFFLRGIK